LSGCHLEVGEHRKRVGTSHVGEFADLEVAAVTERGRANDRVGVRLAKTDVQKVLLADHHQCSRKVDSDRAHDSLGVSSDAVALTEAVGPHPIVAATRADLWSDVG
jgi:hypothetical protein